MPGCHTPLVAGQVLCFPGGALGCELLCGGGVQSLQLRDPMDCSTSGFPVRHHVLEPAQTHVR